MSTIYVQFLPIWVTAIADYKKYHGLACCPLKTLSGEPNTPTALSRWEGYPDELQAKEIVML